MISVTIEENTKKYTQNFTKEELYIGSYGDEVDIPLSQPQLRNHHLKIQKTGTVYTLINLTNDPFVTLNGLPFGKRKLQEGDILTIHDIKITFDKFAELEPHIHDALVHENMTTSEETLHNIVSTKIKEKSVSIREASHQDSPSEDPLTSTEQEIKPSELEKESPLFDLEEEAGMEMHDDLDPEQIEALLHEVEQFHLEEAKKEAPVESKPGFIPTEPEAEFYPEQTELNETEPQEKQESLLSEQNTPPAPASPPPNSEKRSYALWIAIGIALLCLFAGIFLAIFSEHKSKETLLKAARVASDTAMSLLNAKNNPDKPRDWNKPSSLRSNLNQVLSARYQPFSEENVKGYLGISSYKQEIYSTPDLTRFLVMLQPSSSPFNRLIPNKALIVDSENMAIRTYDDITPLSRLIEGKNNFAEVDHTALTVFLEKGQVLPLEELAENGRYPEFIPSKELALINPEANNYLYNAPRYFKMTEQLVDELAELTQAEDAQPAVGGLIEQTRTLSKLPSLVLYTSQGAETAKQAQKGLELIHSSNFPIAYLLFDAKTRKIIGSDILVAHEEAVVEPDALGEDKDEIIAFASTYPETLSHIADHAPIPKDLSMQEVDRMEALKPTADALIDLIARHTVRPMEDFYHQLNALMASYEKVDNEKHAEIEEIAIIEIDQELNSTLYDDLD